MSMVPSYLDEGMLGLIGPEIFTMQELWQQPFVIN